MVCGRPFSESEKSSLVRPRISSPFLARTAASTLTTLTSVEKVGVSWPLMRGHGENRAAAPSTKRRLPQRPWRNWLRMVIPVRVPLAISEKCLQSLAAAAFFFSAFFCRRGRRDLFLGASFAFFTFFADFGFRTISALGAAGGAPFSIAGAAASSASTATFFLLVFLSAINHSLT